MPYLENRGAVVGKLFDDDGRLERPTDHELPLNTLHVPVLGQRMIVRQRDRLRLKLNRRIIVRND